MKCRLFVQCKTKNKNKNGGLNMKFLVCTGLTQIYFILSEISPVFLGLFFLLPSCQCIQASTCESLCVMESHNGSIITLKPRRAELDCKMCVCKCVCVYMYLCACLWAHVMVITL